MSDHSPRIDGKTARELWARAAELQAAGRDADGGDASALRAGGLSLDVVLHAAEGAGIQPESVLLAFAERQLADWDLIRPDDWRVRWLRRLISKVDTIDVQRVFRAAPDRVLAALVDIASRPGFDLALERVVGPGESPTGRVYVFRRQGAGRSGFNLGMQAADARALLVTIRDTPDGTVVRIRAPLFRRGAYLGLAGVASGALSVYGAAATLGVATALGSLVYQLTQIDLGGALAALATIGLGFFGGGSVGLFGVRALHRGLVRRGEMSLYGPFSAVAAEVEPALVLPRSAQEIERAGHQ